MNVETLLSYGAKVQQKSEKTAEQAQNFRH